MTAQTMQMTTSRGESPGVPRFAFVMEQTLGHVTHYKNMRATLDAIQNIHTTWYPLHFPPRGALETLPPMRSNWTVRASQRAHRMLCHDHAVERFDALYFHTQVTTLLSVGLMRNIPSVVSLDATPLNYDSVGQSYGHQAGGRVAETMKYWLNRRALHAARAFVTWCDWARQSLISEYGIDGLRITVIPPGVNLDLWPQPAPRSGAPPVRLLFVGADFERKGGEYLLRAFADGLDEQCELHVVTKADVAPARGLYVYRDIAPNSDMLKRLYATSDVFVLPTLADCFPLAVQEAMAAGLPVVATDVGAIGEAVRNGETGLLVPSGDPTALRLALQRLVDDVEQRRAMGLRGRSFAEQAYNSAANARRILQIMSRVSEERVHVTATAR